MNVCVYVLRQTRVKPTGSLNIRYSVYDYKNGRPLHKHVAVIQTSEIAVGARNATAPRRLAPESTYDVAV